MTIKEGTKKNDPQRLKARELNCFNSATYAYMHLYIILLNWFFRKCDEKISTFIQHISKKSEKMNDVWTFYGHSTPFHLILCVCVCYFSLEFFHFSWCLSETIWLLLQNISNRRNWRICWICERDNVKITKWKEKGKKNLHDSIRIENYVQRSLVRSNEK